MHHPSLQTFVPTSLLGMNRTHFISPSFSYQCRTQVCVATCTFYFSILFLPTSNPSLVCNMYIYILFVHPFPTNVEPKFVLQHAHFISPSCSYQCRTQACFATCTFHFSILFLPMSNPSLSLFCNMHISFLHPFPTNDPMSNPSLFCNIFCSSPLQLWLRS